MTDMAVCTYLSFRNKKRSFSQFVSYASRRKMIDVQVPSRVRCPRVHKDNGVDGSVAPLTLGAEVAHMVYLIL